MKFSKYALRIIALLMFIAIPVMVIGAQGYDPEAYLEVFFFDEDDKIVGTGQATDVYVPYNATYAMISGTYSDFLFQNSTGISYLPAGGYDGEQYCVTLEPVELDELDEEEMPELNRLMTLMNSTYEATTEEADLDWVNATLANHAVAGDFFVDCPEIELVAAVEEFSEDLVANLGYFDGDRPVGYLAGNYFTIPGSSTRYVLLISQGERMSEITGDEYTGDSLNSTDGNVWKTYRAVYGSEVITIGEYRDLSDIPVLEAQMQSSSKAANSHMVAGQVGDEFPVFGDDD